MYIYNKFDAMHGSQDNVIINFGDSADFSWIEIIDKKEEKALYISVYRDGNIITDCIKVEYKKEK